MTLPWMKRNALRLLRPGAVATAAELPLKPGLWYYRVRGLSSTLPPGAQQLAWSTPVRIRIAGPRFKVIRGGRR